MRSLIPPASRKSGQWAWPSRILPKKSPAENCPLKREVSEGKSGVSVVGINTLSQRLALRR
ncbi:hypothetical protein THICB2_40004 [Thiomonas sp. CB2]|nr:hypothetical protein THICB2_40004 [Thiomonas sp. CB2]VDY16381.1 protein of unknown function [Thiomonas sp. CB2]